MSPSCSMSFKCSKYSIFLHYSWSQEQFIQRADCNRGSKSWKESIFYHLWLLEVSLLKIFFFLIHYHREKTFECKNNLNSKWQIAHKCKWKIDQVLQIVSMESVKTTDVENKILFQKVKSFYPRALKTLLMRKSIRTGWPHHSRKTWVRTQYQVVRLGETEMFQVVLAFNSHESPRSWFVISSNSLCP